MKNYVKPVVLMNDDLAEGIYFAASGNPMDDLGSSAGGSGAAPAGGEGGNGGASAGGGNGGAPAGGGTPAGSEVAGATDKPAEVNDVRDPECWSIAVTVDQQKVDGYTTFRVQCNHPDTVQHISTKTEIEIVFSRPVTNAVFEGFDVKWSNCLVTGIRESHGNSYLSGDNYNSLLKVWSEDPDSMAVLSANIYCTHAENVQGKND